jgi:kanamycin nucleotidyltransferase
VVAKKITQLLCEKYKDSLLAVALEGSTAKGMDCPESDLELCVILRDGLKHRWYPFFYRGMFVGISYKTFEVALKKANSIEYTWPVESDALWTAKVLYDPTNVYETLRSAAKEAEEKADFIALVQEALADLYEHVYKIFTLTEENAITAAHEARTIAYWAAIAVGLANKHRYLSSRTMYEESMNLPQLPNDYAQHLPELLSLNTTLGNLKNCTAQLWLSFVDWGDRLGINLNDDQLSKI